MVMNQAMRTVFEVAARASTSCRCLESPGDGGRRSQPCVQPRFPSPACRATCRLLGLGRGTEDSRLGGTGRLDRGSCTSNAGFMWMLGLFPADPTVMTIAGGIVEAVVAA